MARKMRKFSEGGALGKYNRRMADIEKDFKKDSAGKSGRALEVLEAKRMQRTADAEDDRAKRTGADRTATRAAERAAESNLTKTRKYGAPKAVTKDELIAPGKMAESIGPITAPKSGISTDTKKAPVKTTKAPVRTPKADAPKADTPKVDYKKISFGKPATAETAPQAAARVKEARTPTTTGGGLLRGKPMKGGLFSGILTTAEKYKKEQEAKGYAKGGQIMKKKPMPMGGKQLMPLKKKLTKEPITGGSDTVPATSERNEFRKEMMKRNATPGMSKGGKMKKYAAGGVTKEMPSSKGMGSLDMAKGGKAKAKPAAKGKGKPFAATKFGAALMKKSADTKGRAMPKFAKGGSIDGCAIKGKTKTSMVKMARGGAAKMRGRDSYGGAEFKKGGSC